MALCGRALRNPKQNSQTLLQIFAASQHIASVKNEQTYFTHTDHLSSTSLVINQHDQIIEETGYLPFSSTLFRNLYNNTWQSTYYYTGQEFDPEYALYNYNARLYDPIMCRFITPDTIIPDWTNPQSLNRYTYVYNNPLNYTDPSGHFDIATAMLIGAVIGGYVGTRNAKTVGTWWQGALIGSAKGAVSGAISGMIFYGAGCLAEAYTGYATSVMIHATAGALSGATNAAMTGGDIGQGALVGAFSAGMAKALGGGLHVRVITGAMGGGLGADVAEEDVGYGVWMGAVVAVVAYLYNDSKHKLVVSIDVDQSNAKVIVNYNDGSSVEYPAAVGEHNPMIKNKKKLLILVSVSIIASVLIINCASIAENDGISTTSSADYENSPFGFLPSLVVPPFEYGISNPFDFAMDLGIKWDRSMLLIWTLIQPNLKKEEYQWVNDQQLLEVPRGFSIMANIMDPHIGDKYDQYALSNRSFLPRDEHAYRKYVKAIVERYDGDGTNDMPGLTVPIKYWQVDNEPPHGLDDYTAFLKITYEAIKEADPDAKVLIGGVPGMPPASEYIDNFDKHYLPILNKLAKFERSYFDIFDFHWYGNATGDYLGIKEVYTHIQKALKERKLMPLQGFWVTEMGTYSGDPIPIRVLSFTDYPFQTEKQQAIDLVKRNVYSLSLGIKKIFMGFGIKEGFKYDEGYFDFTGLIYDGKYDHDKGKGVKKLSYYAYKKMVDVLENSDWDSIKTVQEKDGIHIYRFIKNGKSIWVAWNDSGKSKRISLRLDKDTAEVIITESVPKYEAGKDVTHYDTAFRNIKGYISESIPSQLSFEVREIPVFVEEK